MSFMLDRPDQIDMYFKLVRLHALKLEIKTGMRHSGGSVMKLIKNTYGIEGGTKEAVYRNFCKHLNMEVDL